MPNGILILLSKASIRGGQYPASKVFVRLLCAIPPVFVKRHPFYCWVSKKGILILVFFIEGHLSFIPSFFEGIPVLSSRPFVKDSYSCSKAVLMDAHIFLLLFSEIPILSLSRYLKGFIISFP